MKNTTAYCFEKFIIRLSGRGYLFQKRSMRRRVDGICLSSSKAGFGVLIPDYTLLKDSRNFAVLSRSAFMVSGSITTP